MKVQLLPLLKELGADVGEFAGVQTALSFGDPFKEHLEVRRNVAVFDISHMGRIQVAGDHSYELLDRLIPKDLSKYNKNTMIGPTAFLNDNAGFKDDVMIYKLDDDNYLIVCNAINRVKILNWLKYNAEKMDLKQVDITDQTESYAMLAIQGPNSNIVIDEILKIKDVSSLKPLEFIDNYHSEYGQIYIISRSGWTGEDGFEIIGEPSILAKIMTKLASKKIQMAGLIARDSLRLEMGYVLYGNDIDETTNPFEARYWVFTYGKKDCVGCDRLHEIAEHGVDRVRYMIRLKKGVKTIPRKDSKIYVPDTDKVIGRVTSGTYSPFLERSIGMVYIDSNHSLIGAEIDVEIRGKRYKGKLLDFPLINKCR